MTDNRFMNLTQDVIYDRLNEVKKSWKIYYDDSVFCATNFAHLKTPENKKNIVHYSHFLEDAKSGELPNYSFVHPRGAPHGDIPANDEHPDHTVAAGERLIKEVYEAVRASPLWNKTLLILTYDEHGGFYDHVVPPTKDIPNPDGIYGKDGFEFKMLGVRIPTIAISPWINKGVIHRPNGPKPSSEFEHSSIPATVKKIFGWNKFLTKRDEWAGTFDSLLLERTEPRTDCPVKLPPAPTIDASYVEIEKKKPVNDLQHTVLDSFEGVLNLPKLNRDKLNQEGFGIVARKLMKMFKSS